MSKELKNTIITDSLLAIIASVVLLLDASGVAFVGAADRWYLILLAYIGAVFLTAALFYRKSFLLFLSALTVGVFASLEFLQIGMEFYETWYLIPIFGGFGALAANVVSGKSYSVNVLSIIVMAASIAMMAAVIERVWRYVLPSIIIVLAIGAIVGAATRRSRVESADEVFYVEPSAEENEDKPSDGGTKREQD